MQKRVLEIQKGKRKARRSGAFAFALAFALTSPTSLFLKNETSPYAAQAQTLALESLDSLKRNAAGYKGSIEQQKRIGDIYMGRFEPGYYKGQLYSSTEVNSVEAFVWYALAVARADHNELLREAMKVDPSIEAEVLSPQDLDGINEARTALSRLKAQSRFKRGAAGWAAERMFSEQYEASPPPAYYILAEMYGSGQYIVRQDYYQAYIYMRVAAMAGFANAAERADYYRGHITFNQLETAERKAAELYSSNANRAQVSPAPQYGGSGSPTWRMGSAISSGTSWGSDFQTSRQNLNAGSGKMNTPAGVDAHNMAQSYYDKGNSFLASGQVDQAKTSYEAAISAEPSSLAAFSASRQLQALTLTCSLRDDRIRRMVRPENRQRVEDGISWERIQLALKALGYYPDEVDGKPDLKTRRAIREFQRDDLNVDETGYLTTDQRVELICAAAQDVRDADAQVQLGIMYARGIGLNCNTAAAHGWFQRAADQGHPTALYNLGMMYLQGFYDRQAPGYYPPGTRALTSGPAQGQDISIRPRKIRDAEVARYFFEEAKGRGHPDADDILKQIKSKKIQKALREHSVIGCIDYEAEIDISQIGTKAADLDVRIRAVLGQINGSQSPAGSAACNQVPALAKELKELTADADDYFSYVNATQYNREVGQSDEDRILSEFDTTRELLSTSEGQIADAQKQCKAGK